MVEKTGTPETGNEQFWQGLSNKSSYIQQDFILSSQFLSSALGEAEFGKVMHTPLEKKMKVLMLMFLNILRLINHLSPQDL